MWCWDYLPDNMGMHANTNRNRATGRYTDTRFDKPCQCGHTLGEHDAERVGDEQPCQHAGCECECFTKARRARA